MAGENRAEAEKPAVPLQDPKQGLYINEVCSLFERCGPSEQLISYRGHLLVLGV